MSYIDSKQEEIQRIERKLNRYFKENTPKHKVIQKTTEVYLDARGNEIKEKIDWERCYYDEDGCLRDSMCNRIYTKEEWLKNI